MKCPFCRSNQTEVYNTRTTKSGSQLWRRRRCQSCHEAFTTYEAPDLAWLHIQASNGTHPPYSRARLYSSVVTALGGHSAAPSTADAITDTIEAKILDLKSRLVPTTKVAEIVLTTLKHFDTPAFLRYLASHANVSSKAELKRQLKSY